MATELFARGIDIEKINVVFNYDMPKETSAYLHRVGRAGRFGTKGLAITFVSDDKDKEKDKERGESSLASKQAEEDKQQMKKRARSRRGCGEAQGTRQAPVVGHLTWTAVPTPLGVGPWSLECKQGRVKAGKERRCLSVLG